MEQELIDTLVGAGLGHIVMPRKEFMKEHKHLIGLLRKYRQHPELAKEAASQEAEMKSYTGGFSKQSGFIRRMMAENAVKHSGQYKKPTSPLAPGSTMNKPVAFDYEKLATPEQKGKKTSGNAYGASPFIQKHFGTAEVVPFVRKRGTPLPDKPFPNKKRGKRTVAFEEPAEAQALPPPPPPPSPAPAPVVETPPPPPAPEPAPSNKVNYPLFDVMESELFKKEVIDDKTMEPFVKLKEAMDKTPLIFLQASPAWIQKDEDRWLPVGSTKPLLNGKEQPGTTKKVVENWRPKLGFSNDEFKTGGLRRSVQKDYRPYGVSEIEKIYINEKGVRSKTEKALELVESTGRNWKIEDDQLELTGAKASVDFYGKINGLKINVNGLSSPRISFRTYDSNLGKVVGTQYKKTRQSMPGVYDMTPNYWTINLSHRETDRIFGAYNIANLYTDDDMAKETKDDLIFELITSLKEKPTLTLNINGVDYDFLK